MAMRTAASSSRSMSGWPSPGRASSRPSAMVPRTRSDQAPPFHRGQSRGGVCARKTIRPTTPRKPYVMVATGEWRRGTTVRSGADSGSLAESRSSSRSPDVGRA
jgi:hypothetical protein